MIRRSILPCHSCRRFSKALIKTSGHLRFLVSSSSPQIVAKDGEEHWSRDLEKTRNIGIIAHIDAGKTTTTERMLYYSGVTRRIGEVDEGSTVTDFLPAERARGITIQSAAITFHWPPVSPRNTSTDQILTEAPISHTINLIDTPGHADFTFEVLRSLRVLDGAVCILDGVAGVEAQTEQVWHQASAYNIPRIIYVNKLDREGASFAKTVRDIGERLNGWPAVCHIPWWEGKDGLFTGLGDVIHLRGLKWEAGGDGKSIQAFSLAELQSVNEPLAKEIKRARIALVELLSEHDEEIVERFFEYNEDHLAVPAADIRSCIRRCVLGLYGRVIPVFAGASFKNIGVQPLLDAVVDFLPSPLDRPPPEIRTEPSTALGRGMTGKEVPLGKFPATLPPNVAACALAFKVVNDSRKGVLVYVRVYAGTIQQKAALYNTTLQTPEQAHQLMKMYASDAVEVPSIPTGHIGVIAGLAHTRTGDTLIATTGINPKKGPPKPFNTLQLRPIDVPPPVFFASLEPHTLSEEKQLQGNLALLLREDPSLHVSIDEDTGQTLLSGMGELHLEIARDRLVKDFKTKADMGGIEIQYGEGFSGTGGPVHYLYDKEIAGKRGRAGCEAIVKSVNSVDADQAQSEKSDLASYTVERDGNIVKINVQGLDNSGRRTDSISSFLGRVSLISQLHTSLANGAFGALVRGPTHFFSMQNTLVTLNFVPERDFFGTDNTPVAITSAARQATQEALKQAASQGGSYLLEPVMNVTITVDEPSLGAVVHDISSARGGHILSLDSDAEAPSSSAAMSPAQDENRSDSPVIDPARIYVPPDPFEGSVAGLRQREGGRPRQRTITARVPLKEMVGYLKHLRSLTAGRGTFVMSVDRFERMSPQRQKAALGVLKSWM